MKRAYFLPTARRNLLDLRIYLTEASGSRAVSRKFLSRLRAHCDHLASLPFAMGRPRPELGHDLRSSAFESYVVFFRYRYTLREPAEPEQARLEVVNILEGHLDVASYFSESKPE